MAKVECPNCGSNNTQSRGCGFYLFMGIAFIITGFLLGLLVPILAIMVVIGIGSIIISPFAHFLGPDYKCEHCGHRFNEKDIEEQIREQQEEKQISVPDKGMNYCSECGAKIDVEDNFCSNCGAKKRNKSD